jgi:tetratricopeptide (TPR) repeat protein
MNRIKLYVSALSVVLLLLAGGCAGGKKGASISTAHENAAEMNSKAAEAFEMGRYGRALKYYHEALRLSRSVEDRDGTAANIINLAAVYRTLGEKEKARESLDEVIFADHVDYPPGRKSEAAFINALIYIEEGDYKKAGEWAGESLEYCERAGCKKKGGIFSLRARITYLSGDYAGSIDIASKALSMNRRSGNMEETANSLRTIAAARSALGQLEEAGALYEKVLSIDKRLGLSDKIALDLLGLGDVFSERGESEEALRYYMRALDVSRGGNDPAGVSEAVEKIEGLHESVPEASEAQ